MKKTLLAVVAAVALALGLAACTPTSGTPGSAADEGPANSPSPAPAPKPQPGTVISDPLPLMSTVESTEWSVSINSVEWDATKSIRAFNDNVFLPDDGNVWAQVNLSLTYTGSDPAGATPSDVIIQTVKDGQSVGDQVLVNAPDGINLTKPIYSGTSLTGNIVLEVPAAVASASGNIIAVTLGFDARTYFYLVP